MIVIKKPDRTLRRQMCWGRRKWGKGIPLPSRLAGLGECRSSPQAWFGAEPRQKTKTILEHFVPEKPFGKYSIMKYYKMLCRWATRVTSKWMSDIIPDFLVSDFEWNCQSDLVPTTDSPVKYSWQPYRFSKKAPIRGISRHSINKIQFSNPKFILCDVKKPTTECAVFSGALTMYLRTNSRR